MEGGRAYARDKLNDQANVPSPLFPQSSLQKEGAYFWELTVLAKSLFNHSSIQTVYQDHMLHMFTYKNKSDDDFNTSTYTHVHAPTSLVPTCM